MTEAQSPRPTTDDILAECPRFRVLVVGRSGVGKSSLINHAFGIDQATVAHRQRGTCDIQYPIISEYNDHFVLHDSMGFEPGNTKEFETAKEFSESRGKKLALKERVHAIWCATYFATKFSGYAHKELRTSSDHRALAELIRTTLHLLGETSRLAGKILMNVNNAHNRETVCITSAIAQHGSAQANIEGSIKIRMKKYWRGIASSTGFSGFKLEKCLTTLHIDIIQRIILPDPSPKLLRSTAFVEKMRTITQVVVPREDEANDWFGTVKGVMSAAGAAGTIHPIAFPIVAGIGLSGIFINWLATVYKRTPETLRLFMGYIVDLTLVLDQLFVIVLALSPPNLLTQTEINTAQDKYTSGAANTVHEEIREYCNDSTSTKICRSNKAEEKITEFIDSHRVKWEGTEPKV
ncbi:hypothetical protein C8J57DRAFT_1534455 [Mycena rebaudengoi]|nr:hypothetical protein C8J57DRAFT_1534455 [Mycena rebaudengoi]